MSKTRRTYLIAWIAILAVLLAELIGEIAERATRGKRRPNREYSIENGEFLRREHEK